MKRLVLRVVCGGWLLLLVSGLGMATPSSLAQQQGPAAIDVFASYRPETAQLDIFFTNPLTGLSALATIDGYPPDRSPLDDITLAANGVIFRSPADGVPRLITPSGRILDIGFIPQTAPPFAHIDWAVSPNGQHIAWAEMRFSSLGWQANLFAARIDGQNYRALPQRPILPVQATRRVAMRAVSNDGQRIFFDSEHLPAPAEGALFSGFQRMTAYLEQAQAYIDLPGEPACDCPALIANNGDTLLRLLPSPDVTGFDLHIWNLQNNRERVIPAIETDFDQAGPMLLDAQNTRLLYMVGDASGQQPVYSLVLVNLVTGDQQLVVEPLLVPLRPMDLIDEGTAAILVSEDNNLTYKLNLATGELSPVAEGVWLGRLEG